MALSPIAFIAPNYRDFKAEWLKAYTPGTTTPKSMALDSLGTTTAAKLELNADGFLESSGGALVIPYVDGAYDLWLFPTEAEADANDTSNAIRVADDIQPILGTDDLSQTYIFQTVAAYKASSILFPVDKTIHLNDRDADFKVIAGIGTATGYKIIGSTTVSQSIDLILGETANIIAFGGLTDGTDVSGAALAANATGLPIVFHNGAFTVSTHLVLTSPIIMRGAYLDADWTPTSWVTIYSSPNQSILPEWFGATPIVGGATIPTSTEILATLKGCQAAYDCIIDISIDPIGVIPIQHSSYNSGHVVYDGGKRYPISNNTLHIRSEHHFLGVTTTCVPFSQYGGGLEGDGSAILIVVDEATIVGGDGAQTCKVFDYMSLSNGTNGIVFALKGDQSNSVTNCRFKTFTDSCFQGSNLFGLQFSKNHFADCAGGWIIDLLGANTCIVTDNVTGESSSPSRGIRVTSGSALGGNIISNNTLRSGYIIVGSDSATNRPMVTVSGNKISAATDDRYPVCIDVQDNHINANIDDNTVIFGNKTGVPNFIGIQFNGGSVTGGLVYGDFDIGVNAKKGGHISTKVMAAKIGITQDNAGFGAGTTLTIEPHIDGCETGISIDNFYTTISGGAIENCSVEGVTGLSKWLFGSMRDVSFTGNTSDHTVVIPAAGREGEVVVIDKCHYQDIAETTKTRSGINKLLIALPLNRPGIPLGGTYKVGDTVVDTLGVTYRCTVAGTPGTWV